MVPGDHDQLALVLYKLTSCYMEGRETSIICNYNACVSLSLFMDHQFYTKEKEKRQTVLVYAVLHSDGWCTGHWIDHSHTGHDNL